MHIANVSRYKILRFWTNLQKYQMLVPAKDSHPNYKAIKGAKFLELCQLLP